MISSSCFMSSADPCGDDIICSNACRSDTSVSATSVQYCSAQKSVMMRMRGMPTFSPSFDIATNFSTIARTLPGLQYMMSRIRNMGPSRWGAAHDCRGTQCCRPRPGVKDPPEPSEKDAMVHAVGGTLDQVAT